MQYNYLYVGQSEEIIISHHVQKHIDLLCTA
jgi:hypothetical protein